MHVLDRKSLLQESGLVFVLRMGSELDLSLDARKLTGFIKGHRMGAIQYIIPRLEETWREQKHRQEKDQTTKEGDFSKVHPTEILNERLIVCFECGEIPESMSSR